MENTKIMCAVMLDTKVRFNSAVGTAAVQGSAAAASLAAS